MLGSGTSGHDDFRIHPVGSEANERLREMRVHYVHKKYASIVTVFKRYCVPWGYLFFFLNFCLQRKDLFRIFSIVSLGNVYKYPKQFKLPNRYLTELAR